MVKVDPSTSFRVQANSSLYPLSHPSSWSFSSSSLGISTTAAGLRVNTSKLWILINCHFFIFLLQYPGGQGGQHCRGRRHSRPTGKDWGKGGEKEGVDYLAYMFLLSTQYNTIWWINTHFNIWKLIIKESQTNLQTKEVTCVKYNSWINTSRMYLYICQNIKCNIPKIPSLQVFPITPGHNNG